MVEKQSKEIYSSGVACIFLSSFFAMFFGIGSYLIYNKTGNDSYIATIIGSIISMLLLYIFYYIFSNNPKENIYKLNENLFNKKIGCILNFILFLTFAIISCIVLYNVSNFLNVEYLPETNINLIKALILVSIIYISSKGLPEIIRANQIFSIISIVILVLDIIGLYPKFEISNLEPIFNSSTTDIVYSVFIYVVLSIVPFSMLLITSKKRIKDSDRTKSVIFRIVLFTNLMQIIICLITILVLGKEFISAFRFPEYIALKQFSLFNILERVENILSLQFYFNSFSLLSLLFHFMINFLPDNKVKKYYSTIISIVLFIVTSIFFKDSTVFTMLLEKYLIYVILIGIMLPIIITFFKMIRINKKA